MKKIFIILWSIFIILCLVIIGSKFIINKAWYNIGGNVIKQYKIVVNNNTLSAAKDETSDKNGNEINNTAKAVENDKKEKTL